MERQKRKPDTTLIVTLLLVVIGYVFIHDLLGGTLFSHSEWDSYTLQAMAWRRGQLDLGQNYSWLELAIYQGKYYVSFPPFPSVVMLPLTFVFGADTPNNFVMLAYTLLTIVAAYRIWKAMGMKSRQAAFFAVFLAIGSNMLWMSTNGGVWFQAQSLNLLLCLWAVYAALRKRRIVAMALTALAVGCRPFSICLFPAFLACFCVWDRREFPEKPIWKIVLGQWKTLILPILIGAAYMWYNWARFGSPLEFGHNYLPEFSGSDAQFGLEYFMANLGNILRPIGFGSGAKLDYPTFNGFVFFVANPFFLLFFVEIFRDIQSRRMTFEKVLCIVFCLCDLFLLLVHKTFGGWQFGARYTCDLLPFAILYIALSKKYEAKGWAMALGIFALMFNAYGALAMTFLHA